MNKDTELRNHRLVFYSKDVDRLDSELDSFLELSNARAALLIDKEGHLVTRRGEAVSTSMEAISALIATQGLGDLYRLYLDCQRDGVDWEVKLEPPVNRVLPVSRGSLRALLALLGD